MAQCQQCGKEVPEGQTLCSDCAAKAGQPTSAPLPSGEGRAVPSLLGPEKKRSALVPVAVVILVLIVLAAGFYFLVLPKLSPQAQQAIAKATGGVVKPLATQVSGPLASLPTNADMYVTADLNLLKTQSPELKGLYDAALTALGSAEGGRALAEFKKQTGLDLKTDILAAIGSEMGMAVRVSQVGLQPRFDIVMTIAVADEAKAKAALDLVKSKATEAGAPIEETQVGGVSFLKMKGTSGAAAPTPFTPGPAAMQPQPGRPAPFPPGAPPMPGVPGPPIPAPRPTGDLYWGLSGKSLVVAFGPDTTLLEQALKVQKGTGQSVGSDPAVKDAVQTLKKKHALTYVFRPGPGSSLGMMGTALSPTKGGKAGEAGAKQVSPDVAVAGLSGTATGLEVEWVSFPGTATREIQKQMGTLPPLDKSVLGAAPGGPLVFGAFTNPGGAIKGMLDYFATVAKGTGPEATQAQQMLGMLEMGRGQLKQMGIDLDADLLPWMDGTCYFAAYPFAWTAKGEPASLPIALVIGTSKPEAGKAFVDKLVQLIAATGTKVTTSNMGTAQLYTLTIAGAPATVTPAFAVDDKQVIFAGDKPLLKTILAGNAAKKLLDNPTVAAMPEASSNLFVVGMGEIGRLILTPALRAAAAKGEPLPPEMAQLARKVVAALGAAVLVGHTEADGRTVGAGTVTVDVPALTQVVGQLGGGGAAAAKPEAIVPAPKGKTR